MTAPELEQRAINVIRGLAMDAPHAARSGHQGTAMALAPLAHVLWTRIMRYDAADPEWPDRDRFVLSAGHASILLYSMLHLTGLRPHARRPQGLPAVGQPRRRATPSADHTDGVEVTTGPLGQGIGNAVGMAIAERSLRARFGADVVDHRTFCIVGDGDLSEGLSHEAASLAGHLGLGRLVCVYDDNHVSIDGPTELALTDDAAGALRGLRLARRGPRRGGRGPRRPRGRAAPAPSTVEDRPSLVVLRSHIAFPSPTKTDDPEAHGYALKDDDIRAAKEVMGLPDEPFYVPDDVLELYRAAGAPRRATSARPGPKRLDAYDGDRADARRRASAAGGLPGWADALPTWEPGE